MRVTATPLLALFVAVGLHTTASAQPCPRLDVRNPDGNYFIPGVKGDIRYSTDLALDAYIQRGAGRRPSVVVIHGGAWSSGSRIAHVGQILEMLTRAGYHWFSLDYRLGGLARFEECACRYPRRAGLHSLQVGRARHRSGSTHPARRGLGRAAGCSAGRRTARRRHRRSAVGGFYDLAAVPGVPRNLEGDVLRRASPVANVVPRMPPLLVVHGGADSEVPIAQARRFCEDVVRNDGRCRLLEVNGASHRSENWWPSQWSYKPEIVKWLSALASVSTLEHRPHAGIVEKDILYSASAQLRLDAFVPRRSTPVPAVIVVHGGGWEAGDKVTYVTPLFEPLARAGLAWFSIDYRLTPQFTHLEQLDDVREAIRFVREHHKRFNIDPARIVLVGESASGQMVTQIATEDRSIAGVVSFYGVYDLPAMVTDASPRSLLVRLFRRTVLDEESRAVLRQVLAAVSSSQGHATGTADQRHRRAPVGAGTGIRPAIGGAGRPARAHRARRRASRNGKLGRPLELDDLQTPPGGLDRETLTRQTSARPRVFIVGGGFAGLAAAKALAAAPVHVTMVDRRNHHVFQPLLYQVATASLSPADISAPIRSVLRGQTNCDVVLAEITGVDIENRQISFAGGHVGYDYLVLAAGATHAYFGHDDWAATAPGLKSIEDATELRRRILLAFESAEHEGSDEARRAVLTFGIVGAGPTGVELAGAIKEIAGRTIPRDYRHIDTRTTRVVLFEAGDRLLPSFTPGLSARAQRDLEGMGVEVRLRSAVTNVTSLGIHIGDEFIPVRNVFWAAGVKASPLGRSLGVPLDRAGRVIVGPDLTIPGHPEVFVAGDMAAAKSADTGEPVPGVAQGGLQMGHFAGKAIASDVVGQSQAGTRQPFVYRDKGSMAVIGKAKAVAQIGRLEFGGFLAWLLWGGIHIAFLIGFRNRLVVLISWFWNWLLNARDARLITGDARLDIRIPRSDEFVSDGPPSGTAKKER